MRADGVIVSSLVGLMFWASLGFGACIVRQTWVPAHLLVRAIDNAQVKGRVAEVQPLSGGAVRAVIDVTSINEKPAQLRVRILIRTKPNDMDPGDWISIRAALRHPSGPVAPHAHDFGRALWFRGITAVGYALSTAKRIEAQRALSFSEELQTIVGQVRKDLSVRIRAQLSDEYGPLATAFLTGERSAIDEELLEVYRDSSLAHMLSISGLHMVMAGFGFFAALRLAFAMIPSIVQRFPVKKAAAAGALAVSFVYMLIAGASPPTQRSFIMIAMVFLAMMLDRPALALRQVALAALVILLVLPESLIDVSFQMSFAAVAALVAAYEWWQARPKEYVLSEWQDKAWAWATSSAATSVIAGLATMPFAVFYFQRVSNYGVVANVLAVPVVGIVVMPAGMLALILMPFGLDALPLRVMEFGLHWITEIGSMVASWPGAANVVPAMPLTSLVLMVAGGLWLCIWSAQWRLLGLLPIASGIVVAQLERPPDVLIAEGAKVFAVRDASGRLTLSTVRRGRFQAESWLRIDGDERTLREAQDQNTMRCDDLKCSAQLRGGDLLIVSYAAEANGSCIAADILVSARTPQKACAPDALVFGPKLLEKEGAITLWRTTSGWQWTSVARTRGHRPWVPLNTGAEAPQAALAP